MPTWRYLAASLLTRCCMLAGPSKVYAAQEKAVLQEFHFILKKVSDRVLKKTAQEVGADSCRQGDRQRCARGGPGQPPEPPQRHALPRALAPHAAAALQPIPAG